MGLGMKRINLFLLLFIPSIALTSAADSLPGPNLGLALSGTPVTGIFPNGRGLPAGHGTVDEGRALYAAHCAACHGPAGRGGAGGELAGGDPDLTRDPPDRTIGTYWPYATSLFDFVERAMPMDRPGSLSADEVYAVVAYVLFLNGLLDEHATLGPVLLANLRMPNRDGFVGIDAAWPGAPAPGPRRAPELAD